MESFLKTILVLFFRITNVFSTQLTAELAWRFFCIPRFRKKSLSKNEEDLLNQAEKFFVRCNDAQIAVYRWKNQNNLEESKTVMLTHGWGGHALNFSYIVSGLLAGGFSVLAFDSPAHGSSSGKQTNLLQNTQALLAVTNEVEPIHALIGHSFGSISSAFALELARESEQLAQVKQIILIAGPNRLTNIFMSFTNAMQLSRQILEIFYQKVETLTERKMQSMNTVDFLQHFSGSILVVHDHGDRIVPFSEAKEVSEGTGGRLFATTGHGHGRILMHKEVVREIVNTLQNQFI